MNRLIWKYLLKQARAPSLRSSCWLSFLLQYFEDIPKRIASFRSIHSGLLNKHDILRKHYPSESNQTHPPERPKGPGGWFVSCGSLYPFHWLFDTTSRSHLRWAGPLWWWDLQWFRILHAVPNAFLIWWNCPGLFCSWFYWQKETLQGHVKPRNTFNILFPRKRFSFLRPHGIADQSSNSGDLEKILLRLVSCDD